MDEAEKIAHVLLSDYHHGKEFFDTSVPTAIHAIESTGIPFRKLFSKPEDDAKAEEHKKKLQVAEKVKQKEEARQSEIKNKEEKRDLSPILV